jgi:hypothetical protein
MENERKPAPFEAEIPVPWSDRPVVVKTSFWLAVVLAILIMVFATAYMWDWDISQPIGPDPTPVISLDEVGPYLA